MDIRHSGRCACVAGMLARVGIRTETWHIDRLCAKFTVRVQHQFLAACWYATTSNEHNTVHNVVGIIIDQVFGM